MYVTFTVIPYYGHGVNNYVNFFMTATVGTMLRHTHWWDTCIETPRFKFMWRVHVESVSADCGSKISGRGGGGSNNYIHKRGWVGGGVPLP